MRHRLLFAMACLLSGMTADAQHSKIGVTLNQGINYTFIGNSPNKTKVGHNSSYGIMMKFQNKTSAISFEPYLLFTKNVWHPVVEPYLKVKCWQLMLDLAPVAGVRINENVVFNTGFFMQMLTADALELVSKSNGYFGTSYSELYTGYHAQKLQAGIIAGISCAIGKKKRTYFTLRIRQYATSPVSEDFTFTLKSLPQEGGVIYSRKAKPTVLFAGIDFFLLKKKKKVNEEEEE
jgi:hypothetical protein